jgi:hypothetical protein
VATSLVIPQCGLIRLIWQLNGVDQAVNILGFYNATSIAITQTLTNTVAAAVKSAFTSSGLATHVATSWTLARVGLRDIGTANLPEFTDGAAVVAGSSATDTLPPNVSYCVTIRTAKAGKSFRGRYYQPGLSEGDNTAVGIPQASCSIACAAFVTAIGAALSTSSLTPSVLSRKLLTHTTWSTATNRVPAWTTQRRRLRAGI